MPKLCLATPALLLDAPQASLFLVIASICPSAQPEPEGNRPSFPSNAFKRTFDVLTELQGTRKG